jgi:hypothetical protein
LALAVLTPSLSGIALADYPRDPAYYPPHHYPPPPPDYHRRPDPGYCDYYARDHAERYAPPGSGAVGGAVRGAAGGAVFGAIVGGKKGARRGALAGAGLAVVANGARNHRERDYAYTRAYEDCMSGFRR